MSADPSGVATLVFLVGAGPAYWGGQHLASKWKARRSEAARDVVEKPNGAVDDEKESDTQPSLDTPENENDYPMTKSLSRQSQQSCSSSAREEQSTTAYTLGLLGYAIGIGNIWRFPYLVGKFGGGAFVLAYVCCLVMIAIPLYLMELVMGQYTRRNTLDCFAMISPRWLGLGWAQALMLFFGLGYYNILLAYSCVYIASSLINPLPWAADSTAYWREAVLNRPAEDEDLSGGLGGLQWPIVLGLLFVWLLVFFSLAFGKKVLEKVTWVTVVGPIVLLLIMLVRTTTLEGAGKGVEFYIGKFDAHVLADPQVWAIACGQILFSLSPGFGTAITMSSFTKKSEDVFRVCLTVAFANSLFSITGGFCIFGILGHLATKTNRSVEELASTSGPGLAFIAIAEGMEQFGWAGNIMSVLFFTMLLTLGLDSTYAWGETFIAYVADFCRERKYKIPLWRLVGICCLGFFLCGLPYCTRKGNDLLDIIDHYVVSYLLLLGCSLECIMFSWNFGWRRFVIAIKRATIGNTATPNGRDLPLPCFWRLCLQLVVPVATVLLLLQLVVADIETAYGGYSVGFQVVGIAALGLCVLLIPSTMMRKGASTLTALGEEEQLLEEELNRCEKDGLSVSDDAVPAKTKEDAAVADSTVIVSV